ncbi:hypothetical protein G7054_g13896 [Neopestalotiopsis clavispora]|nr:hypothetical protein G7054_g13896 [Neopestalotiopsis clavispora]
MGSYSPLCDHCSQIYFPALSCPTGYEIASALEALKLNDPVPKLLPFRKRYDAKAAVEPNRVSLGSLRQIQESSASCPLCMLVYDVIAKDGKTVLAPGWEDFMVQANPDTYQGVVTNSPMDVGGRADGSCFILRRLSLTVESADEQFQAFFDHIAQPCSVGTMSGTDFPFELPTPYHDMYFAGRKRPPMINLDWLRSWSQICDEEHQETCKLSDDQSQDFSMSLIRLLDVHHHCIRTFVNVNPAKIRYIALSYVWGGPQPLNLLKSNAKQRECEGSLLKVVLPQTISDSIEVTRKLDVGFIWIDALCIIQDDDHDKIEQIDSMSMIYRSATLTIIAACGGDCHAGLAGLRAGTREFEQKEVVVIPPSDKYPGMSLLSTCKSSRPSLGRWSNKEDNIDVSVWNSRGWTMQERMLSRRNLIFTEAQVVWACDGAVFCEESYFEHPQLRGDPSRDRPLGETPLRNVAFPSWSWLGWKGLAMAKVWVGSDRLDTAHCRETAQVVPFFHSSRPLKLHHVDNKRQHDDNYLLADLRKRSRKASLIPWKLYDNAAVTVKDIMSELPDLTEVRLRELPEKSLILFWASKARFDVDIRSSELKYENNLDILNASGETVGCVRRTETPQWSPTGKENVLSCEFIAIARRCIGEFPEFPPQVLALQVVWEDSIAYRISIAEIDERAWLDAKPQWKLIAMM